ncbi:hypothetical protein AVEN_54485-1, partial [Araneus ventricosus]
MAPISGPNCGVKYTVALQRAVVRRRSFDEDRHLQVMQAILDVVQQIAPAALEESGEEALVDDVFLPNPPAYSPPPPPRVRPPPPLGPPP